jgi:1-phosphofructokinase family hexose kinase
VDRTLFIDGLKPHDANRVVRCETDAGGKGINAARIIAELGVPVVATGFLGGRTGIYVESVLEDENVEAEFVTVASETRLNISVEDGTGSPPTTFNQPGSAIPDQDLRNLHAVLERRLQGCKFATAGGSLPPNIESNIYSEFVEAARIHGVKMAVDADGDSLKQALTAKPFLVKPNAAEAERLLGEPVETLRGAVRAGEQILRFGAEIAIVSMGEEGAALVTKGVALIAEPPSIDAKSSIGAGDSMVGGFLAGLHLGLTIQDAFRLGAAAGAATAATDGSEIGRRAVIDRLSPNVIIRTV